MSLASDIVGGVFGVDGGRVWWLVVEGCLDGADYWKSLEDG
jgi:hypothetical protein